MFYASRRQEGGPSLNQLLAKGPDRHLNNLAAVVTKFQAGHYAAQGDVKKMFHAVKLSYDDWFLQCFLWRGMDDTKDPETYQVVVNNMGVKPAGSITKMALDKSVDMFNKMYPVTAEQLKEGSYVDDLGVVDKDMPALMQRTEEADEILAHAGMLVHKWIYSKESGTVDMGNLTGKLTADEVELEKVLGIKWDAKKDVFRFIVSINLHPLKKKEHMGPPLSKVVQKNNPLTVLSWRQYYLHIQALLDPTGFLALVLLKGKILLRKTW